MPGWWPESINYSQEILKNPKDVLGDIKDPKVKETVMQTLEQESWSIDATTQAAFDAKIKTMRTAKNYNDIATPENALLLKTFAILRYGVSVDAVWWVNGNFDAKALAILRKCQTDGIGGKAVHVTEWQVDKVSWDNKINSWKQSAPIIPINIRSPSADFITSNPATNSDTNSSNPTTHISNTPDTPPETQANNRENLTQTRDRFIQSLKDIKVGEKWIPSFLTENLKPDAIRIMETGTSWVYEVVLPKGNEQVKIEWTVFIDKDWRLVDKWWEISRDTTLNLTLPGEVTGLYIPLIWEKKWIQALTKNGELNEVQAKELIWLIKSVGLNWWTNTLVLSQKDNGISLRRV